MTTTELFRKMGPSEPMRRATPSAAFRHGQMDWLNEKLHDRRAFNHPDLQAEYNEGYGFERGRCNEVR